jgi:hypothetical protein
MPNILKLTSVRKEQFLELLQQGHTISSAALAVGLSTECIRKHRKKDPEFGLSVEVARECQLQVVEDALYAAAIAGNVRAQIFYLVNRSKHLPPEERWYSIGHFKYENDQEARVAAKRAHHADPETRMQEFMRQVDAMLTPEERGQLDAIVERHNAAEEAEAATAEPEGEEPPDILLLPPAGCSVA